MSEEETSIRLSILRFPLIVGVIFIHNYDLGVNFTATDFAGESGFQVVNCIRNLMSQCVARVSVPLFFLISGYLFFAGIKWSQANYFAKLKSRVKTLLIPFLIWNVTTLAIIATVQTIPSIKHFLSGTQTLISSFDFYAYVDAIVGIHRPPIAYQFWFIRDLIVLCVATPLIYVLVRKTPMITIGIFALVWFLGFWKNDIPSSEAIFFFVIGAETGISRRRLFRFDRYSSHVYLLYIITLGLDLFFFGKEYGNYIHQFSVLFGVVSFLCVSKIIFNNEKLRRLLINLSGVSFFVFAAQEPLLTVIKKLSLRLIQPQSSAMFLSIYLITPILIVILLVNLHKILLHFLPRFTKVISGGR